MNRRGFFGSLVVVVAGLLGFGKAKARTVSDFKGPDDLGKLLILPPGMRLRGEMLVDVKGRSDLKISKEAWEMMRKM